MSYTAKEEVFAMVDIGRGNKIRVARIEGKDGAYAIDIRRFFENDEGEDCPTAKGVRFSHEAAGEIIAAVLDAMDEAEFNQALEPFNGDDDEYDESCREVEQ